MKFLRALVSKKAPKKRAVTKQTAVKRTADSALRAYDKTFKDLARYDRGERFNPISR